MLQIALAAQPSQIVRTILGDQNCVIKIYTRNDHLFVDVAAGGVDLVNGVLAHNIDPLICRNYLGFAGNLIFVDTQGADDPAWDELGTRYKLLYLTADEYDIFQR